MGQLRGAIEENLLELHYQPKVDLLTDRVVAVEALVRWRHAEYGYISPAEFIPLAERTRLIGPLTDWVVHTAVNQSLAWSKRDLMIGMSINVSANDLIDTELVDTLEELVAKTGIDPAASAPTILARVISPMSSSSPLSIFLPAIPRFNISID